MTGTASPRAASRPPVAALPAASWQRLGNGQGGSRPSLGATSPKVCNFKLKKVRNFQLKLTYATVAH